MNEKGEFEPKIMPELKMAPPVVKNAAAPTFFNAEDYAKHLIGNVRQSERLTVFISHFSASYLFFSLRIS